MDEARESGMQLSTGRITDLALLGAAPAFREPLHVGRPNIGDRARLSARIEDILDRRWLTNDGPYVRQFEKQVAELAGTRHANATCNATVGLEIMTRAVGLTGEVIVPAFTFVATAHALQWQEIQPVFCDVSPGSHAIDPERVEELITPRTSGILAVHLWGNGCHVEALQAIAERRGLALHNDASHALACTHGGRPIGGFGRAEIFSFHATKLCNSFEGGLVTTDDDELAERMRLMRNFGFAGLDNVIYLGSNGKMSEVSAAMGITSLESADEFIAANRERHGRYRERLADLPGLRFVLPHEGERSNYHYVVLEVDAAAFGLSRDELIAVLHAENVRARRYFAPGVHRMEPYRSYQPQAHWVLPVTERLSREVLVLPTGPTLALEGVDAVCELLHLARELAPRVRARLKRLPG